MKTSSLSSLLFLSVLGFGQSQAMPLPNQLPVKPYECRSCDSLSHETLSTSWGTENISLTHTTKRQQISRKYQVKASLKQLQTGIAIYTQAPGAIIRITPANNKTTIKPEFRIKNKRGINLSLREASALFSKDEALKNTAFAGNTLSLSQLKPEFGFGEFIISSAPAGQAIDGNVFIIHVFDPHSPIYLSIETDKTRYQHGDELTATISLRNDRTNYSVNTIKASLISAEGETIPLDLTSLASNLYQAKTTLLSEKNGQNGNWYIEVETSTLMNNLPVKRQAHSAFSYMIPSAAIREIKRTDSNSLDFSASIEIATDSRYALQAILYGTDKEGKMHPIQTAQSAAWLAAGQHDLNFSFDSNLKSDYKAPYYLGYLHLTDYGQLKSVFEYDTPIELTKLSQE